MVIALEMSDGWFYSCMLAKRFMLFHALVVCVSTKMQKYVSGLSDRLIAVYLGNPNTSFISFIAFSVMPSGS